VLLSRGELAYVRGELAETPDYRIFREPQPLSDPLSKEVLGFEAQFVGAAELLRRGGTAPSPDGKSTDVVPATFTIKSVRQEANIGDRLWPAASADVMAYVPRAPSMQTDGHIVSIYGAALSAGQNQIVAINRGRREGMEPGHVLALWRAGPRTVDSTDPQRTGLRLPDERNGLLFVFRVFDRVSYALILSVNDPVKPGDRFSQP
jgi:hypothetical protein